MLTKRFPLPGRPAAWLASSLALGLLIACSGTSSEGDTTDASTPPESQADASASTGDGGTADGSTGKPRPSKCSSAVPCEGGEVCCDGVCIDTQSDQNNCGGCGKLCEERGNATRTCQKGVCGFSACKAGFSNCNNNTDDGCEVDLANDSGNCGVCGTKCTSGPNQQSICNAGKCSPGVCAQGYLDCDGKPDTGCEVAGQTSSEHCGACGTKCSLLANTVGSCAAGTCTCKANFKDCDGNKANGCEAALLSDSKNCGNCGNACTGGKVCSSGTCCTAAQRACNGVCRDIASDPNNCGACGNVCGNNTPTCTNGSCMAAYADYLVGTPCNGVDFGDGCDPQETGYHYKGMYDGYYCWWYTKNQAWNTDNTTNPYNLAVHFGLNPNSGVQNWCFDFNNDVPEPMNYNANYNDPNDVGSFGWCGGAPFTSGGWTCFTP